MVSIFSSFYFTFFHYVFYLRNVTSSHPYSVCRNFFLQLRFRNIDNPIFWIYMTTNVCAYLLTQTPECTWFYNVTRDEQWKAKTFADEQQFTLFGPVSIEKICLVEGQVKDKSPVSKTTVTFKNQGTQRALYLYKVPNFMPLSMWESATQNRYHAESNPTQLNSMELSLNEVTGDTRGARVWNLCQYTNFAKSLTIFDVQLVEYTPVSWRSSLCSALCSEARHWRCWRPPH